jgi:phosphonate transport system substrate-binding protein
MRHLFSLSAFVLTCALSLPGQTLAQSQLVLAVSEGTSGGLDHAQVIAKYQGLSNAIGNALKAKVNVVFAREFSMLESGMKAGTFEFVMARPSDYPARAIRDYGYSFVASAKPDGQCFIIVPTDSPLKTLDQAKGKRLAMPEKTSYMSRFCAAELRDRGFDLVKEKVQYVREQAAVGFYLQNKLADVGAIASYSGLAGKLDKDGVRVLHKSAPQPYFPLVASKKIRPEQVRAIQKELLAMPSSPDGQSILQRIGIAEFDTSSEARLVGLLKWLEQ